MTNDRSEIASRRRLSRSFALLACASLLPSSFGTGPNINIQWMLCIIGLFTAFVTTVPSRVAYRRGGVVIVMGFAAVALVSTLAGLLSRNDIASTTSLATFMVSLVAVMTLITSRPRSLSTSPEASVRSASQLQWIVWPLVTLGLLQTAGVSLAWKFTALFYNASYSELLANMRSGGEPVSVFATHSVAAAAYAVLVILALAALGDPMLSSLQRSSLRLAIAGLMVLLTRLLGSTSLLLTMVAAAAIVVVSVLRATSNRPGLRARWSLMMVVSAIALAGLGAVLFIRLQNSTPWGGIAARSDTGAPFAVVPTMGTRLLVGTGFFETSTYSYTDSGILETLVRFGVLGVGFLAMLYLFFVLDVRRVLTASRFQIERWSLMAAVVILAVFELGYEVLTSPRMLPLLLAVPQFAGELARARRRAEPAILAERAVAGSTP